MLAKQRLIHEGPLVSGRAALRDAVITVAFELRVQGIDQDTALAICRTIPFATGSTRRHEVENQIPAFVAFS